MLHGATEASSPEDVGMILREMSRFSRSLTSRCQLFVLLGYDAFFHGNIKLWYFHHWLMMGAALELVVLPYVLPFTYTIAQSLGGQ